MFTGIIVEVGHIVRVAPRSEGRELVVRGASVAASARPGDSIAVEGACLTVERIDGEAFAAFASRETLSLTCLGEARPGAEVNLEPALRVGDRLGGHWVTGHVDALGRVVRRERLGEGWTLGVELPGELLPEVVRKGSIALQGVSLTVARLEGPVVEVAIIPETWARTTLRHLGVGAPVHVETDILGKHVVRALRLLGTGEAAAPAGVTMDLLRRAGFAG